MLLAKSTDLFASKNKTGTVVQNIFLTDKRRDVLNGTSDWSESSIGVEKSKIKKRARMALNELIAVAGSSRIDNEDVFQSEQIELLLTYLLGGRIGGIVTEPEEPLPSGPIPWTPDPDYRNSVYVAMKEAELRAERRSDPADLYEMFGEEARALRELDNKEGIDE